MKVLLQKQVRKPRWKNRKALLKALHDALQTTGLADDSRTETGCLRVILVGPRKIREMNRMFKGRNHDTDVLAFDYRGTAGPGSAMQAPETQAEIYVCPQVAQGAATDYNTSVGFETLLYIVHGMLHLVGERDNTPEARQRMRRREEQVMKKLTQELDPDTVLADTDTRAS